MTSPLAIIGHQGRMGALLLRRFTLAGYIVRGVDQPLDDEALTEACAGVSLVLLCVPAAALRVTVQRVTPYMSNETVLADITSVKVQPMEMMEALWPGAVVGTHPLFGPKFECGAELPVAISPGARATEAHIAQVEDAFARMGCRIFRCTPALHDRAMAALQGLNFISSLAYFATLAQREELLPFLTPSFRRRQESARKLLTEDAALFEGLFEANPHSHEMVRQYRAFLNLAAGGDISLLTQRAAWWWREQGRSVIKE